MKKILSILLIYIFSISANAQEINLNRKLEKKYKHSCFPSAILLPKKSPIVKLASFSVESTNPNKIEVCLEAFKGRKFASKEIEISLLHSCNLENDKSDECFKFYESQLTKRGCDFKKIECSTENPINSSGIESMTCGYFSKTCINSKNNKNCPEEFSSIYLDAKSKNVICMKDQHIHDTIPEKERAYYSH